MNIVKKALAITAILLASFSASASLINVGGVEWDPDHIFDLFGVSGVIYQRADFANGTLDGYGVVTNLNGQSTTELCPGCELTFHFGGYTLDPDDPTADFDYQGGWINFWVDESPDADPNDASQLDLVSTGSEGGDNVLWLSMVGHVIAGTNTTFTGNISSGSSLEGFGAFDVTGGLAAWHLDTNTKPLSNQTTTDIIFASEFTQVFFEYDDDENLTGADAYGSADFSGDSIPEPATLGLFALGLLALSIRARSE